MNIEVELLRLLDQALSLEGRGQSFNKNTPLLGAVPELDSMAVVSLLSAIEDTFGITIDDDEIDAATFSSVGTLVDFVGTKVA